MNQEKPRIPSVHPFLEVARKFIREYPKSEVSQEDALKCQDLAIQMLIPIPDGDPCPRDILPLLMEKYWKSIKEELQSKLRE